MTVEAGNTVGTDGAPPQKDNFLAEGQAINNFSLLSRRGTNTLQYQAFYSRVEYSRYLCSLFSDIASEGWGKNLILKIAILEKVVISCEHCRVKFFVEYQ